MRKRSRFRPLAKWVGACAIVLALLLWVASCFWWGFFLWRTDTWGCQVDCDWGTLSLDVFRRGGDPEWQWRVRPGLHIVSHAWWRDYLAQHGIVLDSAANRNYYGFALPKVLTRVPALSRSGTVFWVKLPLWFPLLILAVPTGILFWRDRRYPAGHCQKCGYNLTGNVSGRCPECGETI